MFQLHVPELRPDWKQRLAPTRPSQREWELPWATGTGPALDVAVLELASWARKTARQSAPITGFKACCPLQ